MIRKIEIAMILFVEDSRGIDLTDTSNWSVALIDVDNGQIIFDSQLDKKGERSYRPKLIVE